MASNNEYKYLLEFGLIDSDDDELDMDFNLATQEILETGEFMCKSCNKKYKTVGGLKRHEKSKHSTFTEEYNLDLNLFKELFNTSIEVCSNDPCLKKERTETFVKIHSEDNVINMIYSDVNLICKKFKSNKHPEKYFEEFFSKITANHEGYFSNTSKITATALLMTLGEKIYNQLRQEDSYKTNVLPQPIMESELNGLNYLSGYVVHKLLKKVKFGKVNIDHIQEGTIPLLECMIDQHSNHFIETISRGGLKTVSKECLNIFYKAEELFRLKTCDENIRNIPIDKITEELMINPDIISIYTTITSNIALTSEFKDNILEKMLSLYLRVRSFSFAKDYVAKQKRKSKVKSKALRKQIKLSMESYTADI